MRKLRKMLCVLAVCCMSVTAFSCSTAQEEEQETVSYKEIAPETREELSSLAAKDERLTGELENKKIKWLSDWDLNADTPIDLAIFQERYGGEIEWYKCLYAERYDMLANYINANEGIDFFYAGNFDAFPKGAIRSMFVPCDDYIDFDSELWKDVKDMNDSVMWKGKHYMTVVEMTGDNCAVLYNRDTVQELGFDDPYELYKDGDWDWDIFEKMLKAFCDTENQKYGLDGWWFESGLSATVGVPYIGMEDGQLVSNLTDGNIERVQNFMYDLYNSNCIAIGVGDFGWSDHPEYIGEGKELFYPVGLWKLYSEDHKINERTGVDAGWKGTFGENCMFVPMPKDPEADAYYIPASMNAYCFVKDGQNPEGVAKWLECKRLTLLNEDIRKIADQKFIDDYAWTQEMIDMKNEMNELAMENPVIDFKNGVTTDLFDMLDSSENGVRAAGKGTPWNESLAAIKNPVQTMIDEANNS
ncbi:MAG: carbohydrate ABC transporter substrate-binding protein [Oscillospiraceae bacterium]|nr:carbohydrate ABC transporter substrate-binding protein [Oscillospiraceae bacterium]